MDTDAYSWSHCSEADDNEMSAYIDMWKCADSPFVAYYIPNKLDIMRNYAFEDVYRPLKNNFGVYFLIGKSTDNEKTIYIGITSERDESKGMKRLREHVDPKTREKFYNKWQSALFVTSASNDWHSGLLFDIERWYIRKYREYKEKYGIYDILNNNKGQKGNSDKEDLARKVLAILALLQKPKFGYSLGHIEIKINEDKLAEAGLVAVRIEELESIKQLQNEIQELKNNRSKKLVRLDMYDAYADWEEKFERIDIPINNGRIEEVGKEPRYQDRITPMDTARDMVNALPAELFNSKTTFIDVYIKSANILIAIMDRLMSDDPNLPINHEKEFSNKIDRINNIVSNQIFGVAGTKPGYINSVRSIKEYIENTYKEVYGNKYREFRYCNVVLPNIFRISNYGGKDGIVNVDQSYTLKEISLKISGGTNIDMRFDVVVGNPPYNDDIYIPFVEVGNQLANKYSLWITPASWQVKNRSNNYKFRESIIKNIRKIVLYPNCSDIFKIGLDSGICYYLMDLVNKNEIDTKVIENRSTYQHLFNSIRYRKYNGEYFTLNNLVDDLVKRIGVQDNNVEFNYPSEYKRYTVVANNKFNIERGVPGTYQAYGMISYTTKNMSILCMPHVVEDIRESIDMTNADVALYTSDQLEECKSMISWINTKFVRFLVSGSIHGISPAFSKLSFRFVPNPGAFDHIFTDEELYKKYSLTDEEINIIESVIKPRNKTKTNKIYLGLKVSTGTKQLKYWIGNKATPKEVEKLQGILSTVKNSNGENIIRSIHIDEKQFTGTSFTLLITNGQSEWEVKLPLTDLIHPISSFEPYGEAARGYPLLNSYREIIDKRVSYANGIIDIDKTTSLTQQDLMANYINRVVNNKE